MVTIDMYGIQLRLVQQERDIELLRQWRNSDHLKKYMHKVKYINRNEQKRWFKSVDNIYNFYFIVNYHHKDVGYVFLKQIDYKEKSALPGIFIYENEYMDSEMGIILIVAIMDFAYFFLGIRFFSGKVLKQNSRAISAYRRLGAITVDGETPRSYGLQPNSKNYDYLKAAERVRKAVQILTGKDGRIEITLHKNQTNKVKLEFIKNTYQSLSSGCNKKVSITEHDCTR